ncbi:MAG: hypothetical protein ACT4P7_02220 [Gemmatimonadaceae bacterium]
MSESLQSARDALSPRRYWWVLLALAPYVLLAIQHWQYLPSVNNGDYAQYLLHAKALAEGRPYSDIGYLFTPYNALVSPRMQPPGWPLLLTPGVAAFGIGFSYPRVLSLLAGLVFLACATLRLASRDDKWIALAAVAMVGVSIETGFATNTIISDLPFAAFIWAFILAADREGPLTWPRLLLLAAIGTYAMSVRMIGVALVPTVALLAFLRPRRDRGPLLVLAAVWTTAAVLALMAVGPDRIPFLLQTLRAPSLLLGRVSGFWGSYRLGPFDAVMYPFPWDLANDAYHAAALALIVIGLWDFVRRFGRSALGAFTGSYLTLLVFSPAAETRYLWPLWPVLTYCMLAGGKRVVRWLPRQVATLERALAPAAVTLLLLGTLTAFRAPPPSQLLSRADVQDLFRWVREERTRGPMRIVFVRARVLTLETGVPAMPIFRTSPERTLRELDRANITHVVSGDAGIGHPASAEFERFVRANAERFIPVYSNSGFVLYRYVRPSQIHDR